MFFCDDCISLGEDCTFIGVERRVFIVERIKHHDKDSYISGYFGLDYLEIFKVLSENMVFMHFILFI